MGMRSDVMTKMRGVDPFPKLWRRRTTISVNDSTIELISLPDLVQAKKTQGDKDWPMVRRLIEVNYFANRENPTPEQLRFWFLELRTPELIIELVLSRDGLSPQLFRKRPLLRFAQAKNETLLADALLEEEKRERVADRQYWTLLKKELEMLRHARVRS